MDREVPPLSESTIRLDIASAPYMHRGLSTRRLMYEVLGALAAVVAAAVYFFGLSALLVLLASVLGAVGTERLLRPRGSAGTLGDGSALLTGALLALTLPPAIPLWMATLGGAVGVALGKAVWGGLGQNLFNPALVGRAFLQAAFPVPLTTWVAPSQGFLSLSASTLAIPGGQASVDVTTMATPLGLAKFEGSFTALRPLLFGNTAGSLGETAGLVLIACGLYLGLRRVFDWRLVVSTLVSLVVASGVMHWIDPQRNPDPLFMIFSGGFLFAAVFMVTDPVTSPITVKGAWIFGAGVGLLVVLIRLYGGLPEGVMYAILLMNAATPLINRSTQPRRFGG
jgi:electron transport complex protein RnfD